MASDFRQMLDGGAWKLSVVVEVKLVHCIHTSGAPLSRTKATGKRSPSARASEAHGALRPTTFHERRQANGLPALRFEVRTVAREVQDAVQARDRMVHK